MDFYRWVINWFLGYHLLCLLFERTSTELRPDDFLRIIEDHENMRKLVNEEYSQEQKNRIIIPGDTQT